MKVALGLLIAAQLLGAPMIVENDCKYDMTEVQAEYVAGGDEINRQEEFMWFYRVYNGKDQKRLWSVTWGYWVTDWIDCD